MLVLYNDLKDPKKIFQNFIKQIMVNNPILLYTSHKANQLNSGFGIRNFSFNVITDNILHKLKGKFDKCFNEMEKTDKDMFFISDWSKVNLNNCEIFLPFLETLVKSSQSVYPAGWKRKYGKARKKTPLMLINAFDVKNLNQKFIQELIKLHERVYLIQKNHNIFSLPTISPSSGMIFPKSHVLPHEILEKLVKDNLKLITLLFLERGSRSGYQILKDVANHFHCILSQGTLYPLLYQLEKENKIAKQNGKGREIIYSLTKKTKSDLQSKKETYLKAYQHLASFFDWGGHRKNKLE